MQNIAGYQPGTYVIDPVHSSIEFSIRHMMVAKVKGQFVDFEGEIVLADDQADSSVSATIDPSSIDTRNADRDAHLRSGDFFATDEFPKWTFVSTGVRAEGDDYVVTGDMQIRGITKSIEMKLEFGGIGADVAGAVRAGATATTVIKRSDFDITFNTTLETGGVMLGEDVTITIDISAVKQ
ncbi:YceI family protein [uncultured Agrococcus sp.]|uniref:YceI family protein n=1 Tax=uncultured Agrococcus sp. TaxID=382258 RepID=UPI0025E908B0|nr:YceI family protein [uncultured Agrococcus sp.]